MDFYDILKKRHSTRTFSNKPFDGIIDKAKIAIIQQCKDLGPSAGNLRAYHVYTVTDKENIRKIAEYSSNQMFIADAPVVMIVCSVPDKSTCKYGERGVMYALQDATISATYIQLAAIDEGLSSCWIGAFDGEKIMKLLNMPTGIFPIAVIPIGYET